MLSTAISALTIMLITTLTMSIAALLSKKATTDREKCSPFECGFDPSASSRLPFSLRFFLIAIIFLIFDVEIALILPMIVIITSSNILYWLITSSYFITILLLGLYHEWKQGALEWTT